MTEHKEQRDRTMQQLEACPVCGGRSLSVFRSTNIEAQALTPEDVKITDKAYGKIWGLERCAGCSHVFANPRPTPEFIQSLYADIVDPLYQEEAEGRQKNFERILTRLEKLRPDRGPLFDVGAATGILMNMARERGWEPQGVEPSSWAVATARDRYGLHIRAGDFETSEIAKDRFAAVTMVDFIEHIPDPGAALVKAREILRSDGVLCLVTPDISSLAARLAGRRWWHYRPAHLAYFSYGSLRTALNQAGLKILRTRRYAWTFSAHYLLTRVSPLKLLVKNPRLASFWRRVPIKLALGDSLEIYAGKSTS
ncbi:MAG: class I SAM-dependent methyltransferase [Candidatus Aminicenantaceae bacterium]